MKKKEKSIVKISPYLSLNIQQDVDKKIDYFTNLPSDIIVLILSYLDNDTIIKVGVMNKKL
jgi:hypothetical protein